MLHYLITTLAKNKYTKMYLKYIYFMPSVLQMYMYFTYLHILQNLLHIYVLYKNTVQLYF